MARAVYEGEVEEPQHSIMAGCRSVGAYVMQVHRQDVVGQESYRTRSGSREEYWDSQWSVQGPEGKRESGILKGWEDQSHGEDFHSLCHILSLGPWGAPGCGSEQKTAMRSWAQRGEAGSILTSSTVHSSALKFLLHKQHGLQEFFFSCSGFRCLNLLFAFLKSGVVYPQPSSRRASRTKCKIL